MLENTDKLITAEDVNTTMQYHCKGLVYLMCGICFGPLWFHSTLWENVQVVRIYLWSKWLRARGYVWHAKVLTCGSILSLFWCPAVRVMVYVQRCLCSLWVLICWPHHSQMHPPPTPAPWVVTHTITPTQAVFCSFLVRKQLQKRAYSHHYTTR